MPQPKSSRSSSSRSSSSRARKPAAASKPAAKSTAARKAATKSAAAKPAARSTAAKRTAASKPAARSAASKPAAKRTAASKPTAKRTTGASTRRAAAPKAQASREEAVRANLTALRDTLRKGVVLTADGVKATLDDAVKRGRITRKDATELSQNLLSSGRSQADDFRSDLEQLLGRGRSQALQSSDRVLREVDRARRRVGVGSSFPITLYDELSATQIVARLKDLTPAQLRKVRDYETRNDGRKSVLGAIEKKLG
jgi:polyhydroxyalkanoate synthesis regulator phasin